MDATAIKMRNKFRGTLLGCGVGDATGFIAEGKSPQECKQYYDDILEGNFNKYHWREPFLFGQYSDDTQQTIQLCESLLYSNGYNGEHYANLLKESFINGEMVGAGGATRQACMNMVQGMDWKEAGTPAPMAGNGSAMRVSPIALWFHDSPTSIIAVAKDQSMITHHDPRCGDGAAIVALAIQKLLYLAEGFNKFTFMEYIEGNLEGKIEDETKHALHILNKLIRKNPLWDLDKAVDYISFNLDNEYSRGKSNWKYISPFVLSTVMWALYSFIQNPDSFEETLRYAIGCGGDVDTTSSICGAMSGAYKGMSYLPKKQIHMLNDKGLKKGKYIIELADDIFHKRFHI
jgi:ADP-ribosylglycohydrolase